jgi:hypothetical protein
VGFNADVDRMTDRHTEGSLCGSANFNSQIAFELGYVGHSIRVSICYYLIV